MTAVTVNQMKCACSSCVCIVNISDAIQKEGKYYCSDACANGHSEGSGCSHHGCECHG
ncbi:MAG: metallothionein [Crocosphaera sp.]|nr:metallothionein [Crocosphaera sp.]